MAHPVRLQRLLAAILASAVLTASCGGAGTGETASKAPAALVTAAPAAVAPAASAAPAKTFLILDGDTVRAGAGLTAEEKPWLDCAQANRFPQGSTIVFRFKVMDPRTAKSMDDKAMKSVAITLGNGTVVPMEWAWRPKTGTPTEYFWRYVYKLPTDYPTGSFTYKIDATDLEGRTGSWTQFTYAPSVVQIVAAGSR